MCTFSGQVLDTVLLLGVTEFWWDGVHSCEETELAEPSLKVGVGRWRGDGGGGGGGQRSYYWLSTVKGRPRLKVR